MEDRINQIKNWLGHGSINIFGHPFSGKDTQGRILADLLKAPLIGGGDILRSELRPANVVKAMAAGDLAPTDYYLELMLPYFSQASLKGQPLVLVSVGRMHGEEEVIVDAATKSGHDLKGVVILDMPEEEVWARFDTASLEERGRRTDDQRHILENRLEQFRVHTDPVIQFYKDKGLLITIDGSKSKEVVTDAMLSALQERAVSSPATLPVLLTVTVAIKRSLPFRFTLVKRISLYEKVV